MKQHHHRKPSLWKRQRVNFAKCLAGLLVAAYPFYQTWENNHQQARNDIDATDNHTDFNDLYQRVFALEKQMKERGSK
jgi:hypothetical protein